MDIHLDNSKMQSGLFRLADIVGSTLGPGGRLVAYKDKHGNYKATKDGVTVAENIHFPDPAEEAGAQFALQVSKKTVDEAGDGTTTATVLAGRIVGLAKDAKEHPSALTKQLQAASEQAIKAVKDISIPVEGHEILKSVAKISANGDEEIAELVSGVVEKVGKDGRVFCMDSPTGKTYTEFRNGLHFFGGYTSHYFMNTEKETVEFDNPLIFISEAPVNDARQIAPILEAAAIQNRPLLVIGSEIVNEALATLIVNRVQTGMRLAVVSLVASPQLREDFVQNISVLTGAKAYTTSLGAELRSVGQSLLGSAERIVATKEDCIIIGGNSDKERLEARLTFLRKQAESNVDGGVREFAAYQISQLTGGTATIYVGGNTPAEINEKKDRVDDAIHAVQAAIVEGVVPGAGMAYFNASFAIDIDTEGGLLLSQALQYPSRLILHNNGYKDISIAHTDDPWQGYDAITGIQTDLFKSGIVDPAKVARLAIENAVSIASIILNTKYNLF